MKFQPLQIVLFFESWLDYKLLLSEVALSQARILIYREDCAWHEIVLISVEIRDVC